MAAGTGEEGPSLRETATRCLVAFAVAACATTVFSSWHRHSRPPSPPDHLDQGTENSAIQAVPRRSSARTEEASPTLPGAARSPNGSRAYPAAGRAVNRHDITVYEAEFRALLPEARDLFRSQDAGVLFEKAFGDVLVVPLGYRLPTGRDRSTVHAQSELMFSDRLRTQQRLSELAKKAKWTIRPVHYQCVGYRVGDEFRAVSGLAHGRGSLSDDLMIQHLAAIAGRSPTGLSEAERSRILGLIDEYEVLRIKREYDVWKAVEEELRGQNAVTNSARHVVGMLAAPNRLVVVKAGEDAELDRLLYELDTMERRISSVVSERLGR